MRKCVKSGRRPPIEGYIARIFDCNIYLNNFFLDLFERIRLKERPKAAIEGYIARIFDCNISLNNSFFFEFI
jgi:hypothetical protein